MSKLRVTHVKSPLGVKNGGLMIFWSSRLLIYPLTLSSRRSRATIPNRTLKYMTYKHSFPAKIDHEIGLKIWLTHYSILSKIETDFFLKSHFQNLNFFYNFIFHKIHIFKISFFTKFIFSKYHFSQNSHFSNIKFLVISR